MRYLNIICILALFVSGCVVTKVHTMPVKTFTGSYDQVWDASIKYLNKDKEPILVADKEKGIISTDWVNMHKVFSVKRYRYDIQVMKIAENQIEVGIVSPQESYSMGDWEKILPHERRAHRMFRVIAKDIKYSRLGVSKKVSSRPFNRTQRGLMRKVP